ncbi:hypothetical protein, partial [Streptomyces chartreusis]|uniref:hypothetical protein n=1 Tax=Streptomyces chartreusis TaxID=1969 RepID=UPI0036AB1857
RNSTSLIRFSAVGNRRQARALDPDPQFPIRARRAHQPTGTREPPSGPPAFPSPVGRTYVGARS